MSVQQLADCRPDRRPLAAGALIAWIAVSPWVWGFAGVHPAVADHVFLVLGLGPAAVMIAALRPAAVATGGAGCGSPSARGSSATPGITWPG